MNIRMVVEEYCLSRRHALAREAAVASESLLLTGASQLHVARREERLVLLVEDAAGGRLFVGVVEAAPDGVELGIVLGVGTDEANVLSVVRSKEDGHHLGAVDEKEYQEANDNNRGPADEEGKWLDKHPDRSFDRVGNGRMHPHEGQGDEYQDRDADLRRPGGCDVNVAFGAAGGEAAADDVTAHCGCPWLSWGLKFGIIGVILTGSQRSIKAEMGLLLCLQEVFTSLCESCFKAAMLLVTVQESGT